MRVLLKVKLDCEPDAAWRAIRDPTVMGDAAWPLIRFESLDPDGFPPLWDVGPHPAEVSALGLVPLGEQVIDIRYREKDGARIQRDVGRGLSGTLATVTRWEHSIAISPASGGRTLYRDQLVYAAGAATAALWPVYWAFWQWRMARIRRFAPTWS